MALILGLGTLLYILLAVGVAAYLLWQARTESPASDFTKLGLAALIAVIGTGFTAMAALYGATRQSATALHVQLLSSETSKVLAHYNGMISTQLAEMKNIADETLTKLKVSLDAEYAAYRGLFNAATVYFYGLRSIARGQWNDETIAAAEAGMISATPNLLHVKEGVRDEWYAFWQRAQEISRLAAAEADPTKRPGIVESLIEEKVLPNGVDLRELHYNFEQKARSAAKAAVTTNESKL